MANETQGRPSRLGKTFKLLLLAFAALAVPVAMDQADVDHEKVRLAGRIAGGATGLLVVYGIFTKMLKVMSFLVVAAVLVLVFLVSEGQIHAPRVKGWFGAKVEARK